MNSIPDSLLRALGWALAHSLWQGAAAALALLILLPRLQTARQRYWAAYGALTAVFVAAVGAFVGKFEPAAATVPPTAEFSEGTPVTGVPLFGQPFFETTLGASFSNWLEANHLLVVAAWLTGFVFFLLRLGGGLWQVHRLRTRGLHALAGVWEEKTSDLGKRLAVKRSVRLFESVGVRAPVAIGFLKPAILLPIGFVNQLTVAEVEAVLAHEMAHIARRDWVFNLLQAFVESLFYYHPAVWWISQVIRRERENACDDAALTATGNPLAFARALVQVQEMAAPSPALALAMSGKSRHPLLFRVRRILNQTPPQQHQVMEKITATVILLALLALVGLRANSVPSIEAAFAQMADVPSALFNSFGLEMPNDSLPKPKSTRKITREEDDQRVEAEYKDGNLTRLNIDGKEVPPSEFEQHEALIESLESDIPAPPPPPAFFREGPGPHRWDVPAPPGAPGAPEAPSHFWFRAPAAPMPPMPLVPPIPGGISIATDKDEAGNTILKLHNHGNETEVIVKNGEVWIDGKKLEKGESLDVPGLQHFFGSPEGFGFHFGEGDFDWDNGFATQELSAEVQDQINREMELARAEHERAMEETRRHFEREHKRAEKEWKKNQKNWEKEQKRWEKEQQAWEREQQAWHKNNLKREAEHKAWEAKSKAAQELLKESLLRDGLISNPGSFSLHLSAKVMKVNGKKQSETLRLKYVELLQGVLGKKFEGEHWNYNFNYSGDKK